MDRIYRDRTAVLGVIGLGYVGLPLACAAASAGYRVIGFDIDPEKVSQINRGTSYIGNVSNEQLIAIVRKERLQATTTFEKLNSVDAIIICVPTPLTRHREPDLSFVESTARSIKAHLRRGQLIVLESTTWPGTTMEVLRPILESAGLTSGKDFYLAFSPEREDPGNVLFSTRTIPKIVGADDATAAKLVDALYGSIVDRVITVSSTKIAEAVKLTENIFRSVNIALVNELKVVYNAMGIDVWEVIDAAKTKPFGFMAFYPGPGLGGHCIPIDPFYLAWKARAYNISTRFIELAGEINTYMPHYVVDRLALALDLCSGHGLREAKILIVGVAYKKNIGDVRESPAFTLIELIEARGASVDFYDPHVAMIPKTREHKALAGKSSITWALDKLGEYDASVIVTDHDAIDYSELCRVSPIIIDTRNVCARVGYRVSNVFKA